ncbi:MAG: TonB-dependent receptor [Acidobacteria bacterium]|nr:TonB-dependent receptor [Acidobacteriota bacterium]
MCAVAFVFPVAAQSNKGTITGTVTDPNGAVVKDATVTATNAATGETRTATTSEDGTYVMPALDPGLYSVRIEAAGFQPTNVQEVKLETGGRQAVDVVMTVGAVGGDTVTVTAEAPLAETETSVRGDLITGREVTDLPLPQRNFTLLATLSPGVTRPAVGTLGGGGNFTAGGVGESTESTRFRESGGSVLAVNGARVTQNNFMLDGVDNNETQFGQIAIFPDPDSIAEFRIDTSVPPAESGRAGGAVISTTIKSGGNDFHGTLYEFYQGAFASAKPTNNPNPGNFVQHNYGGVIGGPIFLPNFGEGGPTYWSGRNKSFFFFSYNKQKGGRPIPEFGFVTVPTARMRVGDFGELLQPGTTQTYNRAGGGTIVAPVGTVFCANAAPAAGNDLRNCGQAFSPAGLALLNAYPLPTQGGLQNNYARNRKFVFDQKAYTTRLDHTFNEKNTLFGRYSFSNLGRGRENNFPLGSSPNGNDLPSGFGAGNEFGKTRQIALGDTHTFTPTVVNDARAGYSRVEIGIFNTGVFGAGGFSPTVGNNLGIAGSNVDANSSGIPLIGVSDVGAINQLEFVGDGGPFYFTSNNYSFLDTVTVVRGSHTVRLGGDLRLRQNTQFDAGRAGSIKGHYQYGTSAGGFLTGNYNGIGPEDSGSATANVLLGYAPAFASRGIISYTFLRSNKEIAFFVQDDWKATPTLTLNLGLRYDMYTAPTERHDAQYNFDPASGRLVRAGDASGLGRDLANTDRNNFAPRVGFAWSGLRDDRRMVVRGGYGVVYTPDVSGQLPLPFNAPTSSSYTCTLSGTTGTYQNCPQLTRGTEQQDLVLPPVQPDVPVRVHAQLPVRRGLRRLGGQEPAARPEHRPVDRLRPRLARGGGLPGGRHYALQRLIALRRLPGQGRAPLHARLLDALVLHLGARHRRHAGRLRRPEPRPQPLRPAEPAPARARPRQLGPRHPAQLQVREPPRAALRARPPLRGRRARGARLRHRRLAVQQQHHHPERPRLLDSLRRAAPRPDRRPDADGRAARAGVGVQPERLHLPAHAHLPRRRALHQFGQLRPLLRQPRPQHLPRPGAGVLGLFALQEHPHPGHQRGVQGSAPRAGLQRAQPHQQVRARA